MTEKLQTVKFVVAEAGLMTVKTIVMIVCVGVLLQQALNIFGYGYVAGKFCTNTTEAIVCTFPKTH